MGEEAREFWKSVLSFPVCGRGSGAGAGLEFPEETSGATRAQVAAVSQAAAPAAASTEGT